MISQEWRLTGAFFVAILVTLFSAVSPADGGTLERKSSFFASGRVAKIIATPVLAHLAKSSLPSAPRLYDTQEVLAMSGIDVTSSCIPSPAACSVYELIHPLPNMNMSCTTLTLADTTEKTFSEENRAYLNSIWPPSVRLQDPNEACNEKVELKGRSRRNIILTMAHSYGCRRISLFLRTLRATGSDAEVYIYADYAKTDICKGVMQMCGQAHFVDSGAFPGVKLEIRRYVLALQWILDNIESLSPCSQVCTF